MTVSQYALCNLESLLTFCTCVDVITSRPLRTVVDTFFDNYIRQVNGVKLADALLCVCVCVCARARTQSSLQQCVSLPQCISHLPHATRLPPQPISIYSGYSQIWKDKGIQNGRLSSSTQTTPTLGRL